MSDWLQVLTAWSPDSARILCLPMAHEDSSIAKRAAVVCAATGTLLSCMQYDFLRTSGLGRVTCLDWGSTGLVAMHVRREWSGRIVICKLVGSPPALQLQRQVVCGGLASELCFAPSGRVLAIVDHGSYMAKTLWSCCNVVRIVHAPSGRRVTATVLPDTIDMTPRSYGSGPAHKQLPCVGLFWSADSTRLSICGPDWWASGGIPWKHARNWPVQQLSFCVSGQGWVRVVLNHVPGGSQRVRFRGLSLCTSLMIAVVFLCAVP